MSTRTTFLHCRPNRRRELEDNFPQNSAKSPGTVNRGKRPETAPTLAELGMLAPFVTHSILIGAAQIGDDIRNRPPAAKLMASSKLSGAA
jgi:hypothetical protein